MALIDDLQSTVDGFSPEKLGMRFLEVSKDELLLIRCRGWKNHRDYDPDSSRAFDDGLADPSRARRRKVGRAHHPDSAGACSEVGALCRSDERLKVILAFVIPTISVAIGCEGDAVDASSMSAMAS
jgi:hypothetical protein